MKLGVWSRRLIAAIVCLALVCAVCLAAVGCGKKAFKSEEEMPEKARAKSEQMREQGMKAVAGKAGGQEKQSPTGCGE